MEMTIDFTRNGGTNAINGFKVGQPGIGDTAGRAEMMQQGLFACPANARHIIEHAFAYLLGPFGAVRANRPAMRLIAQALNEIQDRVFLVQPHRGLAGNVQDFLACVTINPLGNPHQHHIFNAQIFQHLSRHT